MSREEEGPHDTGRGWRGTRAGLTGLIVGLVLAGIGVQLKPDVIVADISMPGLDGIEASLEIRRSDPQARIVLITIHTESILVDRGLAAGALGYLLKDAAGEELLPAVHAGLAGDRYVNSALSHDERTTGPD